jgi:DNA-directed RNA polymerase subunit M/transcription elongation factor TFIIS
MRFCTVCNNILNSSTTTGDLIFICNKCGQKESSNDEDTLLYYNQLAHQDNNLKFESFIKTAPFDPTNPKIQKKCEKCSNDTMTYVRVGSDMRLLYICTCGFVTAN